MSDEIYTIVLCNQELLSVETDKINLNYVI